MAIFTKRANAQIQLPAPGFITTVAGNGTLGYAGDGGPAISAEIAQPYGTAVDASGNLYISDTSNNRIRRVGATTGIITTVAGNGTPGYSGDGGPAISAELRYPKGVAVDASGNLYIADTGNERIRKVAATTEIITTVAGNGTSGYAGDGGPAISGELAYPRGVAVDPAGSIYIADTNNSRIRRVTASTGIINTVAGRGGAGYSGDGGSATSAELSLPAGASVNVSGSVFYIADSSSRIRAVGAVKTAITVTTSANLVLSGSESASLLQLSYPAIREPSPSPTVRAGRRELFPSAMARSALRS